MEEFRIRAGSFPRFAAAFFGPLVLFFAVCLLLGAIATSNTAFGILIGAIATAGLLGVLFVKHRRLTTGTVVRFSPDGVELQDSYGFRVRLRWPDITGIDVVETRIANPRRIGRPGGTRVSAAPLRSAGLIGWGEREVPARLPGWMRERLAAAPIDPVSGRPQVAIPLSEIDPLWESGAMGGWIRRHRPDLLGG